MAGIKNAELKKIIGDYDAIITRSGTTVDAETELWLYLCPLLGLSEERDRELHR